MSRTFKTRPVWVHDYADGVLHHDHRGGICREQTLDDARRAGRRHLASHWRRCRAHALDDALCRRPDRGGSCSEHRVRVASDVTCRGCASATERPTCTRVAGRGWWDRQRRLRGDAVPAWFVTQIYHSPMRRSSRDVLRRAVGEYNAGFRADDDGCADLEDRWEPPVLPASGADWLWW
ncbi:hypothetical protein KRMM14A1004_58920 [Krasilnikovia sp. MM14-A1004]